MKMKIKDIYSVKDIVLYNLFGIFTNLGTQISTILQKIHGYEISDITNFVNFLSLIDVQTGINRKKELALQYYIERSADKTISPIFDRLIEEYGSPTQNDVINCLTIIISQKFAFKWYKIYSAFTKEYQPLENYDMEEIRTPNLTENVKRNQSTDIHQETESGIYGFNSTTSNPTATGEGDTTGLKANNETEDLKTNTGTESLTRHGNIGVTTSQQMLESEIKLRQYGLLEEIFKDIDSILCLKIY